jgi:hypothetical protein
MRQAERAAAVPTAMAVFPTVISRPPREWGERSFNVQRWTEMPCGGHFAALEEPAPLVEDIGAPSFPSPRGRWGSAGQGEGLSRFV